MQRSEGRETKYCVMREDVLPGGSVQSQASTRRTGRPLRFMVHDFRPHHDLLPHERQGIRETRYLGGGGGRFRSLYGVGYHIAI